MVWTTAIKLSIFSIGQDGHFQPVKDSWLEAETPFWPRILWSIYTWLTNFHWSGDANNITMKIYLSSHLQTAFCKMQLNVIP